MNKIKALVVAVACCAALTISAAGLALSAQQNSNQNTEACCDMKDCCSKDAEMACCKKKDNHSKNAHACCKGKDGSGDSCCCKGDSCPMPNKKSSNTNN